MLHLITDTMLHVRMGNHSTSARPTIYNKVYNELPSPNKDPVVWAQLPDDSIVPDGFQLPLPPGRQYQGWSQASSSLLSKPTLTPLLVMPCSDNGILLESSFLISGWLSFLTGFELALHIPLSNREESVPSFAQVHLPF